MKQSITKSISISGHQIAYDHREGSGPTLVFVHGITTYRFIWRKLFPLFPAEYNLIAMDLLGCGDSDKPLDVSYSIKEHANRLAEFTAQLNLPNFHLVGHDVGGGVSQIFAVNNSDKLLSLTLLNSVAYDFWPVQPIIAMRTPIIRQMAMATLDLGMFRIIVKRGLHDPAHLTDELMELFWYPMKTSAGRKAFLHFAKCLDNQNLLEIEADLLQLTTPTLIIRGQSDPYLSEKISHRLKAGIPGSQLHLLKGGSHFIQEDIPQEIVDLIINTHLSD